MDKRKKRRKWKVKKSMPNNLVLWLIIVLNNEMILIEYKCKTNDLSFGPCVYILYLLSFPNVRFLFFTITIIIIMCARAIFSLSLSFSFSKVSVCMYAVVFLLSCLIARRLNNFFYRHHLSTHTHLFIFLFFFSFFFLLSDVVGFLLPILYFYYY